MNENIAVLGAGCWGITLATLLSRKNYNVSVWEISEQNVRHISKYRKLKFLPGVKIPLSINISSDMKEIITDKRIIIFAVSSQYVRETARSISKFNIDSNCIIINAAKGLELNSMKRMSEVISEELPKFKENICTLSGPSFAIEVMHKIPTAVVISGRNIEILKKIQKLFSTEYFRLYTNTDIIGVEYGGALKNIFAIACGISDGVGYGDNTKSTIITRGITEIVKLGTCLGAKKETFFGLSGLGDLITTCFSKHSRNRLFGEKIGSGLRPIDALKQIKMVVEGYKTANSAYFLAKKNKLELPIINEIYYILYENKPVKNSISNLMLRKLKSENIF